MQENTLENEKQKKTVKRIQRVINPYLRMVQGILWFVVIYFASGHMAYAADANGIITAQFDTLLGIVTAIISSIGTIVTLWGISEWGIAFQSQDGTAQAHAFKRIAGGLVMLLAPQLINLF